MADELEAAMETLHQLKSTEPPVWLAPKQELSEVVRAASRHLFSCMKPHTRKSPFDQLLVEGFDAEQIWQQIDLQSHPLISSLRREVRKFEKNPEEISRIKEILEGGKKNALVEDENGKRMEQDDEDDDMDLDDDDDEEEEEGEEGEEEEEDRGRKGEGESEEDGSEMEGEGKGGIEDRFLKIKELQEYLEADEAREFGLKNNKSTKNKKEEEYEEEEEEEEEEDDDDDEEEVDEDEDELGIFDGDDDEDADKLENARYEDFFGSNKKKGSKGKSKFIKGYEEDTGSDDDQDDDKATGNHKKDDLSTHEKELEKLQSKIEQMEKANLDPKVWTMRGEVTAAQRQKNSALEVDLDFEHNVRPAPVITEEVTASLEDMIKNRVVEERFDDVRKAPTLSIKAPREVKELDETKSKKSLAEIYEEEYMKKTNPASAPLSFPDEQKKEASMLFKKLCLKLDALSHFHFTPKPVIEEMSIQTNLPALAMEEIAPVAVSDAAMLAPEEVFAGKGDIKEDAELTKAERKRRRANKKRKYKTEAAKGMAKKTQDNKRLPNQSDGKAG